MLLVLCILSGGVFGAEVATDASPRPVDPRRAAAAGIRVIDGERLRLYTDLPSSPKIDRLPEVFAAAVPHWASYFGLAELETTGWKMQGYLISDREKFKALGLLPEANPDFVNGYANAGELWLLEQPSDYYRRHLLLHEGTHGFMLSFLGGCGAGWYMEGTAELLGTHRYVEERLQLNIVPASRDAAPMWGRTKLVRDAVERGEAPSLRKVLAINNRGRLTTAHYAWSWTLSALLERDPRFHDRFRALQQHVQAPDFNVRFVRSVGRDWETLARQWRATLAELDYGYDFARMSLVERSPKPPGDDGAGVNGAQVDVAADRGWQSTGWLLREGQTYVIEAGGRYQVAVDPERLGGKPWQVGPTGVTLDYYRGQPLGALIGVLEPVAADRRDAGIPAVAGEASFARPMLIGAGRTLTPAADAVLYLRVNDSPARLDDNRGSLRATIRVD